LNIGDPQAFVFVRPHCQAVTRGVRDSFTGYAHSTGLPDARTAAFTQAHSVHRQISDLVIVWRIGSGLTLALTQCRQRGGRSVDAGARLPALPGGAWQTLAVCPLLSAS